MLRCTNVNMPALKLIHTYVHLQQAGFAGGIEEFE
jgi:hypothetical protein